MSETKQKLISREYILLTLTFFLVTFGFFAIHNSLPFYVVDKFDMNEQQAGVVVGVLALGILSSRFIAGRLAIVLGYRKLLLCSLIGIVIVSFGYLSISSAMMLRIVRFLHGFFFGLVNNTNMTIVGSIIPKERSGEGVGYYSLGQVVSTAIGPFIGLSLSMNGNFSVVFLVNTICTGACLLVFPLLRIKNIGVKAKTVSVDQSGSKLSKFFEFSVLPYAIVAFLLFCNSSGTNSFVAPFAESIGLEKFVLYYFPINAAVIILTRPFVSKLYDKKGPRIVVLPAIGVLALGMLINSQTHQAYSLLIASALIGFGYGAISSALLATVVQSVSAERLSVANATYFMFVDLAASMGPMVFGTIIYMLGFRGSFIICFIIILVCAPIYFFVSRKKSAKLTEEIKAP